MQSPTYAGSELLHFVGRKSPQDHQANYLTLKNILAQECVTHDPHDPKTNVIRYQIDWEKSLKTEELIVPSVVCFTDIPVSALSIHVTKYGKFGLGFEKGVLIRQGARPVAYIPMRSDDVTSAAGASLLKDIEAVLKGFNAHILDKLAPEAKWERKSGIIPDNPEAASRALKSVLMREFIAFLKPYNSELPDDHPNNFYMEKEWRRFGNFHFTLQQVKVVTVAKGFENILKKDFPSLNCKIEAL